MQIPPLINLHICAFPAESFPLLAASDLLNLKSSFGLLGPKDTSDGFRALINFAAECIAAEIPSPGDDELTITTFVEMKTRLEATTSVAA